MSALDTPHYEWTAEGPSILAPAVLHLIEQTLVRRGSIIVEHRILQGGGNPPKLVFDHYDGFVSYLKKNAKPGDNVLVWCYDDLCRDDNMVTHGKVSDPSGLTPRGGAY